jgi:large-conductance mechanosensitive channel
VVVAFPILIIIKKTKKKTKTKDKEDNKNDENLPG